MHLFAKISSATLRSFTLPTLRRALPGALCLLAALGQSTVRADEPRIAPAGSVSPAPLLRSAHLLGRLDAGTSLRVGLTLPLRNQSQLSELLRRQYTPGDALFHQFLTPPDFTARFGPTVQDYEAVKAYALAQGLAVTDTSPGRTLLCVAGPSARIEAAFGVQMGRYRLPSGRLVFANSAAPLLPRSIAVRVAGVVGLNNVAQMHPQLRRMSAHPVVGVSGSILRSRAPVPITSGGGGIGSGDLGGLTPNDIKYAYDLSAVAPLYGATSTATTTTTASTGTLDGTGQNIGLFELDGYAAADIATYVTTFSLPTVLTGTAASVTTIPVAGFDGNLISVEGQTEVELDIDMVLALAPAATGVYVYEENQSVDSAAPITIFTRMANDLNPDGSKRPLLSVISCSWGLAETLELPDTVQGENALFQQMATQGQSLFCASADQGAYDLFDSTAPAATAPAVDNPASQPYATGVGGTTLNYVKPATAAATGVVTPGAYVGETVWSAGVPATSPEGSGGGVSSLWPKPAYQLGVGSSPTRREVPDVALNADPNTGYTIYAPPTLGAKAVAEVVGGTSAAAPLWAAYTALINQQRTANGLSTTVGFLNPLIYPLGAGSSYTSDFHDITSGTNLFYQAGIGYDDATGYGSFIGAPLLAALSFNANQGSGAATVSGSVTDSSLVPVAGATVTAVSAATGTVVATATTDTTGAYTLTVPSGLALKVTVTTSGVTAPLTENLQSQTVTVAALTAAQVFPQSFALASAAHVYSAGIQMISAPFDYSGIGDFAAVFGLTTAQAQISPRLVQYAPSLGSYLFYPTAPADTLRLGQGYWVKFPAVSYLHLAGTPASTAQNFSIPLQQGWNQIGDPFTLAASFSSILVVAADGTSGALATSAVVQPTLYSYDPATGLYVALAPAMGAYTDSTNDALQPYVGYWVFAFQKCSLSVPYPGPPGGPVGVGL